jgi:hypothetical protein
MTAADPEFRHIRTTTIISPSTLISNPVVLTRSIVGLVAKIVRDVITALGAKQKRKKDKEERGG